MQNGNDASKGCYTDNTSSLIDYILSDMSLSDYGWDFDVENKIESFHMPVKIKCASQLEDNILERVFSISLRINMQVWNSVKK
jgi:hypothetical protein